VARDAGVMKQLLRRASLTAISIGLLATGMLATAPAIAAKGSAVVHTGSCSASSDWKLKVSPDDGRLEVEFEVDQNRNGQTWNVVLKHNGTTFFSGQRTTTAPSGSFSVTKRTANAAGTDTIVGRASNPKTGEVCRGAVDF
jgi:hypothetical protein